jgi:hypothetical protein
MSRTLQKHAVKKHEPQPAQLARPAFPWFLNAIAPLCQGRVRYDQQIFGFFQPTFGD